MSTKTASIVKWASIATCLVGVLLIVRALPMTELSQALEEWVADLGAWGPVLFGAVYALATVCFVPGAVLTIASGALFGPLVGFVVVSISATAGATLAFLVARYLARSKVESFARENDRFGAIDDAVAEGGWKVVALLRLSPAVPFNALNFLLGVTRIGLGGYVLASWLATMPGTFMYVYLGHVGGVAAGGGGESSTASRVLLGVGLVATVAVTIYITRLARKKLHERAGDGEPRGGSANGSERVSTGRTGAWVAAAVVALALGILAQVYSSSIADALS